MSYMEWLKADDQQKKTNGEKRTSISSCTVRNKKVFAGSNSSTNVPENLRNILMKQDDSSIDPA